MKPIKLLTLLLASVLSLNISAQIPSYIPKTGLVGWWPFNGNANDESGNGNHRVINVAKLTKDRNELISSCYSFNSVKKFSIH